MYSITVIICFNKENKENNPVSTIYHKSIYISECMEADMLHIYIWHIRPLTYMYTVLNLCMRLLALGELSIEE